MNDRSQWHMVDYGVGDDAVTDHYGLKAGDGVGRGVPEGTKAEWEDLIAHMRRGEPYREKRLAWDLEDGVHSPRNQSHGDGRTFLTPDADEAATLLESLLASPQAWREDGLKTC